MRDTGLNLNAGNDNRATMVEFIREHFGDVLGSHAALLDQPGGLDLIADMIKTGEISTRQHKAV